MIRVLIGKARFEVLMNPGQYYGEVNKKGEAYGKGIFTARNGFKYSGIFINNKLNGYCK